MSRLLTEIMFVQAAAQNKDHQVTHVCSEAEENTEEKLLSLKTHWVISIQNQDQIVMCLTQFCQEIKTFCVKLQILILSLGFNFTNERKQKC